MGCDVKDYDNDGWVDIFYNNLQCQIFGAVPQREGRVLSNTSARPRRSQTLSRRFSGWSNGFIDYDNDGWKDIYSSNGHVDYVGSPNPAQSDTMWQNQTGKNFADVSGTLGPDFPRVGYQRGSAFADLNNDGWQDLIVTSLNERPRIMLNSRQRVQSLAAPRSDRNGKQPGRDRREGEADDRVRARALQPRLG